MYSSRWGFSRMNVSVKFDTYLEQEEFIREFDQFLRKFGVAQFSNDEHNKMYELTVRCTKITKIVADDSEAIY